MQLEFERWLSTQGISRDALALFLESVVCYKAGAYRAALLMSYLGFQSTVRDRILATAAVPAGVPPGKWSTLQRDLRDDNIWDAETFDATQVKSPAPIFAIAEGLRQQIMYWKDRRNDCAHSKANAIGSSYVESFWLFVQSNLAKMVVNGSSQSLLAKIGRHFDPTYTPPGSDARPLADEIASAIDHRQLSDFFAEVTKLFTKTVLTMPIIDSQIFIYFEAVFAQQNEQVRAALVSFLSANEPLLVGFLKFVPARVLFFAGQSALIRRLWTVYLFDRGLADFALYAALVRNSLIPVAELDSAHRLIIPKLQGGIPDTQDAYALHAAGFFGPFDEYAFNAGNVDKFTWGNPNAALIRLRLEWLTISDAAVQAICNSFRSEPCAHGPRDALTQMFASNPDKRTEFRDAAARLGLELPALIPSLQ